MSDLLDRTEGEMLNAENKKMAEVREKRKEAREKLVTAYSNNTYLLYETILTQNINKVYDEEQYNFKNASKQCALQSMEDIKNLLKIISNQSENFDSNPELLKLFIEDQISVIDDTISNLNAK